MARGSGSGSDDEVPVLGNDLYQSALESSKPSPPAKSQSQFAPVEMDSIMLYQSNQLPLLSAPDSDTLVFICAPPQQSGQTYDAYAPIARHFDKSHKIRSKNLFDLGSAKFQKLLGPSSQFRIERRLRNEGLLPGGKPSGIKYLLDLRPPSEDEDAILLITELSCSKGILEWFKAQKKYDIPRTMVSGQDDSSLLPKLGESISPARKQPKISERRKSQGDTQPHADSSSSRSPMEGESSQETETRPKRTGNWEGIFPTAPIISDGDVDVDEQFPAPESSDSDGDVLETSHSTSINAASTKEPGLQPEYSQLRHRSAIERLIHAIEGNDPMLDSAPKLWTYFAVATFFGCANSERISRWITRWLFTAPNHNFIQCNPEVCYRIGLGIQSESLIKDAFSLLVGEKALMNVHREHALVRSSSHQVSVAGRKLELLDDDELNRIDHAANVFIQRIQSVYDALIGQNMLWLKRSAMFRVLDQFVAHSAEEEEIVRQLMEDIKSFVRSRVIWVMARDYKAGSRDMEQVPESVQPFYHHASPQFLIYNDLSKEERILSRFFWTALRQDQLDLGEDSVFTLPPWEPSLHHPSILPVLGWSRLARKLQEDASESQLLVIQKSTLLNGASRLADILQARYWDAISKMGSSRAWSKQGSNARGKYERSLVTEAYSRMQSWEDEPGDPFAYNNPVGTSALHQFENLHLSSSKRGHGVNPEADFLDNKRTRLDPDGAKGDKEQANGKRIEIPIRAAPSHSKDNLTPADECKDNKVAVLQAGPNPNPLASRLGNVKGKTPADHETGASTSEIGAAPPAPGKSSQSRKEKLQELPELGAKPSFRIHELLIELTDAMDEICDEVVLAAHFFRDSGVPPTDLIDSLTCLTDEEWKYLPLWAGGRDDGSGGVFDGIDVPDLETGSFGAHELGKSSTAGSSSWSEVNSTVGKASKEAVDGTATETATVQSLGDVDMDVRSLDDESSAGDTGTVVNMNFSSAGNLDDSNRSEMDYDDDDDDIEDDAVALEEADTEDIEETGWDDCDL